MKKTVAAVLAVLMLLTAAAAAETIQIGIILPYTGNLALYGESMYEGATLAAKEINEKGGVLGCELEIVKYDDMNDPNESLNGFNSLYMDGVELMIGPLSSTCTAQIVDAANNEGVVLLTATATNDALDTEDNYVFRSCYLDSFQGAIGAAFAYQQGYKKVGVVYCASDTYSKGLGDSFIAACEKYGVEIVAVESTATLDYTEYTNQFLAMVTLWAITFYLVVNTKKFQYWLTLVPATFMTMVTISFIFVSPSEGLGTILPRPVGYGIAGFLTIVCLTMFFHWKNKLRKMAA